MKKLLVVLTMLALTHSARAAGESVYEGTWSAPSLSQWQTPIIITLLPDGQATEQVGSYHGTGTWKIEQGVALITWSSGWTSLLRRTSNGQTELLTWRKETPPENPPDDLQPAHRAPATSETK